MKEGLALAPAALPHHNHGCHPFCNQCQTTPTACLALPPRMLSYATPRLRESLSVTPSALFHAPPPSSTLFHPAQYHHFFSPSCNSYQPLFLSPLSSFIRPFSPLLPPRAPCQLPLTHPATLCTTDELPATAALKLALTPCTGFPSAEGKTD